MCALSVLAAAWIGVAVAQTSNASGGSSPLDSYTLRVSSSLLQLPVLVTDHYNQPVTRLDTSRFRIRFESGLVVVPKLVRPEGNDPITLGILIDGRLRLQQLEALPAAMEAMAKQLRPADRVAIWATDGCHLRRFAELAIPDAQRLRDRVVQALTYKPAPGGGPDCVGPRHLWDGMAFGVGALAGEPGRRVLLAITGGDDSGSIYSANQLAELAAHSGVAVFAITPPGSSGSVWSPSPSGRGPAATTSMVPLAQTVSYIATITSRNGGTILEAAPGSMPRMLERFVEMLRARYIMEFAQPANLSPGHNSFQVLLGASGDYNVVAAGTSVPVPDSPDPAVEHGVLQRTPPGAPPNQ